METLSGWRQIVKVVASKWKDSAESWVLSAELQHRTLVSFSIICGGKNSGVINLLPDTSVVVCFGEKHAHL